MGLELILQYIIFQINCQASNQVSSDLADYAAYSFI